MLGMASPAEAEFKRRFTSGTAESAQALLWLKDQAAPNLTIYLSQSSDVPVEYDPELTLKPAPDKHDAVLTLLQEAYLRHCKSLLFKHPYREGEPTLYTRHCQFVRLHSKNPRKAIVETEEPNTSKKLKVAIDLKYLVVPKLPTKMEYGNTKQFYCFLASRVKCGIVKTTLEALSASLVTNNDDDLVFTVGSELFCCSRLWAARATSSGFWKNKGTPVKFMMPIPVTMSVTPSLLAQACEYHKFDLRCLFTQWIMQRFATEAIDARIAEEDNKVYVAMTDHGVLEGPLWLWREFIETCHVKLGQHPVYGRAARQLLFTFGAPHSYASRM
jgi:hypothetical protein